MRVSGSGRPTGSTGQAIERRAQRAARVPASPAFSSPSEIDHDAGERRLGRLPPGPHPVLPRYSSPTARDWPRESAAFADGAAGLPANSSSCRSPLPAAFAARMTSATAASLAARGTLCERSTSTSTRGRLRASSHENPSSDSESATSAANCSASATKVLETPALTWIPRLLVFDRSVPLSGERDQFPQQHEQRGHEKWLCPIVERVRGSSARARPSIAPARSDGATFAEPAPRSAIAISSSKSPPRSRSNIKFTSSGISGPRRASVESKSSDVSRSFDAPARLTISGSSPAASKTASPGRASSRAATCIRSASSLMRRDSGTADDHCTDPCGRVGARSASTRIVGNAAGRGRRPTVQHGFHVRWRSFPATARAGCAETADGAQWDTSHRSPLDVGAAGARSRTISSSSASASPGCSVARTLGRCRDRRVHERECSRVEAETGSADFARVRGEDDHPRFGRGPAVRDLEQHVIPFRIVQVSTRRQPLQSDVARDAGHLDDAIRAAVAGPLEQRGVRTVRQQPMQAVAGAAGPRVERSAASVRRQRQRSRWSRR